MLSDRPPEGSLQTDGRAAPARPEGRQRKRRLRGQLLFELEPLNGRPLDAL